MAYPGERKYVKKVNQAMEDSGVDAEGMGDGAFANSENRTEEKKHELEVLRSDQDKDERKTRSKRREKEYGDGKKSNYKGPSGPYKDTLDGKY